MVGDASVCVERVGKGVVVSSWWDVDAHGLRDADGLFADKEQTASEKKDDGGYDNDG